MTRVGSSIATSCINPHSPITQYIIQDAARERTHHRFALTHRRRAERRFDQRAIPALTRGVHKGDALLLFEQEWRRKVIQQRLEIAAKESTRLQHVIDFPLLEQQPVSTG